MFEQDWIMRQIREICKMMAHVLFDAEVCSTVAELPQEEKEKAEELISRMKSGRIQETVDDMNRLADDNTKENLMIGLAFYSELSNMSDDFLQKNAYSLVKARKDFEVFAEKFGMQQMTDLYFGSLNE